MVSAPPPHLIDRAWLLRNWKNAGKNFVLFYICMNAPAFNIQLTGCPLLLKQPPDDKTDLAAKKTLASQKAVTDWNDETNTLLMSLAAEAYRTKDSRLRSLYFTAGPVHRFLDSFSFLRSHTVFTLLSARAPLTVLELDFLASNLLPDDDGKDYHVCTAIAAHLSTLEVLKLRMRSLCPAALTSTLHFWPGHGTRRLLRLHTVVVDMRLPDDADTKLTTFCAQHPHVPSESDDTVVTTMRNHITTVLIPSMAKPKSVRLLWSEPQPEPQLESTFESTPGGTAMVSREWAFGEDHRVDSTRNSTGSITEAGD